MADMIHVHAETPQPRRITQIAEALRAGRVIAYPTDSSYGLACAMGDKIAFEVDDVDARWREGWSVLLQGVAREVTDPERKSIIDQIGLLPWAGAEAHTIELEWHRISGRQIV